MHSEDWQCTKKKKNIDRDGERYRVFVSFFKKIYIHTYISRRRTEEQEEEKKKRKKRNRSVTKFWISLFGLELLGNERYRMVNSLDTNISRNPSWTKHYSAHIFSFFFFSLSFLFSIYVHFGSCNIFVIFHRVNRDNKKKKKKKREKEREKKRMNKKK